MNLKEFRQHKKQCAAFGVKVKSTAYQSVLFRLCELYDSDLVVSHWVWISKILAG